MFSHFRYDATLSRQVKNGNKTLFTNIPGSIKGHLRPLADEQQNIGFENMANMFSFTTCSAEDIREADRLKINGETYSVRGVNSHMGIRVSYTRCIIIKEEQGR